MHRITDVRVGGVARRNFSMFRKLCGDENLRNVAIVTNMWGDVDFSRAEAREMQLRTDPDLFQPAVELGATLLRHQNTVESARAIISHFSDNYPITLCIQRELVDECLDISETSAGQELDRELIDIMEAHKAKIQDLQLEVAANSRDIDMKRELDSVGKELREKITQLEHDRERISAEYQEEKRYAAEGMRILERNLEEERGRMQREIDMLQLALQDTGRTSVSEREALRLRIRELEQKQLLDDLGLFGKIGVLVDEVLITPINFLHKLARIALSF